MDKAARIQAVFTKIINELDRRGDIESKIKDATNLRLLREGEPIPESSGLPVSEMTTEELVNLALKALARRIDDVEDEML